MLFPLSPPSFLALVMSLPQPGPPPDAPGRRALTGEDAKRAEGLEREVREHFEAGRYADARGPAREVVAIRTRLQGQDHWEAVAAKSNLVTVETIAALPADARDELTRASELHNELARLQRETRYREGIPVAARVAAARERHLGKGHGIVARSLNDHGIFCHKAGQYAEAEALFRRAADICKAVYGDGHPQTAGCYGNLALSLQSQGEYAKAQSLLEEALRIHRRAYGEDAPETAVASNNLAGNLDHQGSYDKAEPLYRRALEVLRRAHGEDHEKTATAHNNLGYNLHQQGKNAEADREYRQALRVTRALWGADHPETALVSNNLAVSLADAGRYADAEPLYRKALEIYGRTQGAGHPLTAATCGNLALTLSHQGKLAEAESLFRKALRFQERPGEKETRSTAVYCNNLASNLQAQGRQAEAKELLERALAIYRRLLGEEHPDTAQSYHNLATHLHTLEDYAKAEPLMRASLDILRRRLGEGHPHTATALGNLAVNLYHQEKYAEAREPQEKALAIHLRVLGEGHPNTALTRKCSFTLAWARGQYQAAEEGGVLAAKSFEAARRRVSFTGLGRADYAAEYSPWPLLAALAARNGKPAAAWQALENHLARGLLDDVSARPLTDDERRRERELLGQLNRLDGQITALLGTPQVTPAARENAELLSRERDKAQARLSQWQADLAGRYGVAAGDVYELDRIQARLPADAALVTWVDMSGQPHGHDPDGEHWACVVRRRGPPVWVRLPGSGPGNAWTAEDDRLASRLRQEGSGRPAAATERWKESARALYAQRLAPAEKHLGAGADGPAVRHLIVLPSARMRGIPVEALTDRYTVSYAPSGTMFAWLREKRAAADLPGRRVPPPSLLAVGDPVFEAATPPAGLPPPPDHGVLITAVTPGSNAAAGGIQAGDVLLRYAEVKLESVADLKAALGAATGGPMTVPVRVWREGRTLDRAVRPGLLGVLTSDGPAGQAVLERRELDQLTRRSRGAEWTRLHGAGREMQAVTGVFRTATVLKGSEASQQNLDKLSAEGRLGQFRYLHFATHGLLDQRSPLRSALILAQDSLPDPLAQVSAGKPAYDGRLTAERILRDWRLDADLVTLSACDTGLGKFSGGEGYLGFSQALFLAGARSLVLSLWQVDDASTALLMTRFYENLLGARAGREALPKARALAEAKAWLRGLKAEETQQVADGLLRGLDTETARGTRVARPAKQPGTPAPPHPYAHPYYWSGFILIGDPG